MPSQPWALPVFVASIVIAHVAAVSAQPRAQSASPSWGGGAYVPGTNIFGRSGLFFTDTAETSAWGRGSFTGHFLYDTDDDYNQIRLPFGFNYGLMENVEISANLPFISRDLDAPAGVDDSQSGLGSLAVGGKLRVPGHNSMPDIGLGLDLGYGPLSDDIGEDGLDFNVKGMVTQTFSNGILVNGGLGVIHIGSRDIDGGGETDSETEVQLNGGVGVPLMPNLTGIAELAINQFGEDNGVFSLGVRGGRGVKGQVLLGIGVGDNAPDLSLGAGVNVGFGG